MLITTIMILLPPWDMQTPQTTSTFIFMLFNASANSPKSFRHEVSRVETLKLSPGLHLCFGFLFWFSDSAPAAPNSELGLEL